MKIDVPYINGRKMYIISADQSRRLENGLISKTEGLTEDVVRAFGNK